MSTTELGAPPTAAHLLVAAAREAPHAEALVFGERRLSYREYHALALSLANELSAAVPKGARIATVLGNSADTCITFFAVHLAGATLVPLNPLYTARELRQILLDADPALLIADDSLEAVISELAAELGLRLTLLGDATRRLIDAAPDVVAEPPQPRPLPEPDDLALVQYTGGTTGAPKGVQLTHRAIATNVAQREALLPTRPGVERVLCVMPLFHSYALSMALYLTAHARGTLVVLPRYHPDGVLAAVEQERITLFPGNPTIFTGLLGHPRAGQTDWSSVIACYSGSAALAVETLQRWERLVGAPVIEGYGQTEAGPVLTFNPQAGPRKPGSVGIPVPGTTVEVVDTDGMPLPAGSAGEIRARGPQLMTGYRNRPEETAAALRGGWLHTGDIGEYDTDGYLSIRDRLKELVIVGGYNVYPREVEEVLFAHPAVGDAAVIGVPDGYRGEILAAYVVLERDAQTTLGELVEHCRTGLAKYKVPARIEIVEALPKTAVNKTDKVALRKGRLP